MSVSVKWLVPALVLALPLAASAQSSAQSNDAKYCSALVAKYEQYLDMSSKKGAQPQSLDSKVAVEKCKAGDTVAGIPVLEQALKNAKLDLPPRG